MKTAQSLPASPLAQSRVGQTATSLSQYSRYKRLKVSRVYANDLGTDIYVMSNGSFLGAYQLDFSR
jgi:hypothetical protein